MSRTPHTHVKVVDRDGVVDALSQLRDVVDEILEWVNDRAVLSPSLHEEHFEDGTPIPTPDHEK